MARRKAQPPAAPAAPRGIEFPRGSQFFAGLIGAAVILLIQHAHAAWEAATPVVHFAAPLLVDCFLALVCVLLVLALTCAIVVIVSRFARRMSARRAASSVLDAPRVLSSSAWVSQDINEKTRANRRAQNRREFCCCVDPCLNHRDPPDGHPEDWKNLLRLVTVMFHLGAVDPFQLYRFQFENNFCLKCRRYTHAKKSECDCEVPLPSLVLPSKSMSSSLMCDLYDMWFTDHCPEDDRRIQKVDFSSGLPKFALDTAQCAVCNAPVTDVLLQQVQAIREVLSTSCGRKMMKKSLQYGRRDDDSESCESDCEWPSDADSDGVDAEGNYYGDS